jgi:hypothetical protein
MLTAPKSSKNPTFCTMGNRITISTTMMINSAGAVHSHVACACGGERRDGSDHQQAGRQAGRQAPQGIPGIGIGVVVGE